ncbi:hypothetical protein B0H13DRAFT_2384631 [Mycena leptocephala]|nr:hypothetical protein B0H13DRAFT_2384631 [Mycena leptocephala]
MALTPSPAGPGPSHPCSWIYLAASRSRIVHRGPALTSVSSARFPFGSPRSWYSPEAAFFAFARFPTSSPPPRCACHGTSTTRATPHMRVGAAARPVHVCEAAAAATSPNQRISHASSWNSCTCRWGGDDEARRWGSDDDWMKTEKRTAGNGKADEDGVGGSTETVCSLEFDALSFCPPAFTFALAPAFVPTFAHPSPPPYSSSP